TRDASSAGHQRPLSDLTAWASSGIMSITGFPHRPPTLPAGDLSPFAAGMNAAIAAIATVDGEPGVEITVRVQEILVGLGGEKGVHIYLDEGSVRSRDGASGLFPARGLFPANDGWVLMVTFSDIQWDGLATWMASLGASPLLSPGDFAGDPQGRFEL